jgi:N-acetylglucosaminyldiphosphoundecaprenol N-acetyl-beta-D-mannosaminyltransferase
MNRLDTKIQRLVPARSPIAILGVPFDNVTATEAVAAIEKMVTSRRPHYLVTANVDFVVQAQKDVELRRILIDADLVLCDGTPLVWASRFLGNPLPERVAGSDLAPMLFEAAARAKRRVFLLGATPDSVEEAAQRVKQEYPSLVLAGYYSPPFRTLLEMDHEEIKRRVCEAKPDLLFVAFGCPKAEKWIAMHYRELGVPVVAGVGATIDFLAGRVKRAPHWMRKAGMEWIFRLVCEPRRLFRRYARDLWVFGWKIIAQWWLLQCLPRLSPKNLTAVVSRWWEAARWVGPHCIMDLSGLRAIDSTAAGLLLLFQKKLRAAGRYFVLASPSAGVRRALALMGLENNFDSAPNAAAAQRLIEARTLEEAAAVTGGTSDAAPDLAWHGEITAVNASAVWNRTRDLLSHPLRSSPIAIDLSDARFIDTSGLAIMVQIQQWAWRQGKKLVFTKAQPAVLDVLRISKCDQLLLEKPEVSGLIASSVSAF